jgi:hypothetical protein
MSLSEKAQKEEERLNLGKLAAELFNPLVEDVSPYHNVCVYLSSLTGVC